MGCQCRQGVPDQVPERDDQAHVGGLGAIDPDGEPAAPGRRTPDIITVNNGWQSLGTLAKAGLVLNLDPYTKLFQWDRFPSTILRQTQFSPDGKTMGAGSLFAAPVSSSSLIGLYYNKSVLDKAECRCADRPRLFRGRVRQGQGGGHCAHRLQLAGQGLIDRDPARSAGPLR